jgi:hypothetical protein
MEFTYEYKLLIYFWLNVCLKQNMYLLTAYAVTVTMLKHKLFVMDITYDYSFC